jgi:phage FluMu gp28-like protein
MTGPIDKQPLGEVIGSLPPDLSGVDILLPYQKELLEATARSSLVITDKSRRVGMTWAAGADAVLTSALQRSEGGQDTFYLGYNLDMAREFIDTCAEWAKAFSEACTDVEEMIFEGEGETGERLSIKAFRITFASGYQIQALSSNARSLRGRQGFVILDEFAFHDDAKELLKAAMALLIWGGRVLVISTHNGDDNPFNELIQEVREGRRPGTVVRVTFDEAIEQGLYRRICLVKGTEWTPEGEIIWADEIRGFYGSNAEEELDCVPSKGSGTWLSSAQIEAAMDDRLPVLRIECPKGFEMLPERLRKSFVDDWIEEHLDPVLSTLSSGNKHAYGFDFARSGDLSVMVPIEEMANLNLRVPFVIEMRNVPFREQEQLTFYAAKKLPGFVAGKHDARGNGQYLAEVARQEFGEMIEAVMLTQGWYLENFPPLKADHEDRSITYPKHADIKNDMRVVKVTRGIPMVSEGKSKGTDGGQRHGDFAVALVLARAAIKGDWHEYAYRAASEEHVARKQDAFRRLQQSDIFSKAPNGARIRGGF